MKQSLDGHYWQGDQGLDLAWIFQIRKQRWQHRYHGDPWLPKIGKAVQENLDIKIFRCLKIRWLEI